MEQSVQFQALVDEEEATKFLGYSNRVIMEAWPEYLILLNPTSNYCQLSIQWWVVFNEPCW